ncbi:transglutaminase domain-containing protein [Faecalibaculum rodentium]|nr:transglutaminase domain-containing protein [Faecalibaculum rodentium]
MYRLYNVFSSEHLYTASPLERDVLKKSGAWNYEGIAWRNPLTGGNNVFRLYNPANSEHHYTTSPLERDSLRRAGWNYEGVGWLTDAAKSTAVYRLYNPHLKSGYHLFTTSKLEYDALTKMGWRQEGIAWYAAKDFSTAKGSHYLYGNYAYDESGRQSGGIQKVGNDFYYANPDNGLKVEKREGLYKTAQGQIYVTGSGKLVKGQKQIGTSWKWFRPENALMAVNSFIDIPAAYNSGTAKTCYYDASGNMVKGVRTINGLNYSFDNGSGAWNNRVDVDIQKLCQNVYNQVGRDLKAVYDWCVRNIRYQSLPIPLNPPAGYTAEQNYAIRGLRDKRGNCYCYAAAVTSLARNLGYQARYATGGVLLSNGSYSNHGWCVVTINGARYILDAEAEIDFPGMSFYMQPAGSPKLNYKEY